MDSFSHSFGCSDEISEKEIANELQIAAIIGPIAVHPDRIEYPIDTFESRDKIIFVGKGSSKLQGILDGICYGLNVWSQFGQKPHWQIQLRFAHLHQVFQGGRNVSVCDPAMISVDPVQCILDILQQLFVSFFLADDGFHLALKVRKLCRFLTVSEVFLGSSQEETILRTVYYTLPLGPAALGANQ